MILYGHPGSTCTRKVLATLAEKNAAFDFVMVDLFKGENKQPAHLARQPFGQVPVLDHNGFHLYESRAIIRYLDEVLPGVSLRPSDAQGRAKMEQLISVETSNFTPGAMKIIYQVVFAKWRGQEPNMDNVVEGRAQAGRTLDILDAHLADREFLVGDQLTLADICYMPYLEYLEVGGEGLPVRFPGLSSAVVEVFRGVLLASVLTGEALVRTRLRGAAVPV